jgi:hypothetical protein
MRRLLDLEAAINRQSSGAAPKSVQNLVVAISFTISGPLAVARHGNGVGRHFNRRSPEPQREAAPLFRTFVKDHSPRFLYLDRCDIRIGGIAGPISIHKGYHSYTGGNYVGSENPSPITSPFYDNLITVQSSEVGESQACLDNQPGNVKKKPPYISFATLVVDGTSTFSIFGEAKTFGVLQSSSTSQ